MDWQQEDVFFSASDYYLRLMQDIRRAQKDIILEVYFFSYDDVGSNIIDALTEAAGRGVNIRVLIDGIGSIVDGAKIADMLSGFGIDVRIYHPVPWKFRAYRHALTSGTWLSKFLFFVTRMNNRDHRKLVIIDYKIAWVGSINITRQHISDEINLGWKDAAVRVDGDEVSELYEDFDYVWRTKLKDGFIEQARYYWSNHSEKSRKRKNLHLIEMLGKARSRIYITNAYFSPTKVVLEVIKAASRRGVDVQVLLPGKSDLAFLFPAVASTYYGDMLNAGIRVFEYKPAVLHAKTIVIDNCAIIGSTNLNYRSALHDLELDVILESEKSVLSLLNEFERNKSESTEIDKPNLDRYSRWSLLLGFFSRFVRYWL